MRRLKLIVEPWAKLGFVVVLLILGSSQVVLAHKENSVDQNSPNLDVISQKASEKKTLIIGGVQYPPLAYLDGKGGIYGPAVDFLSSFFDGLDQPYRWVGMNQHRLSREIVNGSLDLTVATKKYNPLIKQLLFSVRPWACLQVDIFSRSDLPPLNDLSELKGAHLVHYYYFADEDIMEDLRNIPDLTMYSANNRQSAVKMMQAGRVQYYLDFYIPALETQNEMGVQFPSKRIFQEAAFLAAPLSNQGSLDLMKRVDVLMETMHLLDPPPIADPELLKSCEQ